MVKALSLALLLPTLLAAGVPDIRRPVTDTRGLLSSADTEAVADGLVRLRTEKGVQMAVLIVGTTGETPIEDYAVRAAEAWKGGEAGKDNGLLLVVAVDDRRMRLEVGYGLEPYLPDDEARRLLDAQGALMRSGNHRAALLSIVRGVQARMPEVGTDWKPWRPDEVRDAFMWMLWAALAEAMLLAACFGRWRERLGSQRLVAVTVALVVLPLAVLAFISRNGQVPTAHFLLSHGALVTAFFLGALAFRHVSARLGGIIVVSVVLGGGLAWGLESTSALLALLSQTALLAGGIGLALAFLVFFFWSNAGGFTIGSLSGSSWDSSSSWSSSDSSWFSSSSDSSSSDSSWSGGGGDFGGGGASSSW